MFHSRYRCPSLSRAVRIPSHHTHFISQYTFADPCMQAPVRLGPVQALPASVRPALFTPLPIYAPTLLHLRRDTRYQIRDAGGACSERPATESGDSEVALRFAGSGIWPKTCNTFLLAGGDIAEIFTVGGAGGYGGFGTGCGEFLVKNVQHRPFVEADDFSARSGWSPGRFEKGIETDRLEAGGRRPEARSGSRVTACG